MSRFRHSPDFGCLDFGALLYWLRRQKLLPKVSGKNYYLSQILPRYFPTTPRFEKQFKPALYISLSGQLKYECNICQKLFNKNSLPVHMRIHQGKIKQLNHPKPMCIKSLYSEAPKSERSDFGH